MARPILDIEPALPPAESTRTARCALTHDRAQHPAIAPLRYATGQTFGAIRADSWTRVRRISGGHDGRWHFGSDEISCLVEPIPGISATH